MGCSICGDTKICAKGLCRRCYNREQSKKYYSIPEKREKILQKNRRYYMKHKKEISEYHKQYFRAHPEYHKMWWRKKHPLIPMKIKCLDCGKEIEIFKGGRGQNRKYCNECRLVKTKMFYTLLEIRSKYASLYRVNPKLAKQIKEEMIAKEGEEFTKMAIDGIDEKTCWKRRGE